MKRSQTLLGGLIALFALWVSLAAGLIPVELSKAEKQVVQLVHDISPDAPSRAADCHTHLGRLTDCILAAVCYQLPLWAVVSFGAYSLASIGYNLFTFRECPAAFTELEQVSAPHHTTRPPAAADPPTVH